MAVWRQIRESSARGLQDAKPQDGAVWLTNSVGRSRWMGCMPRSSPFFGDTLYIHTTYSISYIFIYIYNKIIIIELNTIFIIILL